MAAKSDDDAPPHGDAWYVLEERARRLESRVFWQGLFLLCFAAMCVGQFIYIRACFDSIGSASNLDRLWMDRAAAHASEGIETRIQSALDIRAGNLIRTGSVEEGYKRR